MHKFMLLHTRKILFEKMNSVKVKTYFVRHLDSAGHFKRIKAHEIQFLPNNMVFLCCEQIVYICPIDKVVVELEEPQIEF